MNDRIAGTTWDNPIWYRKFRIYLTDHCFVNWEYVHDDYDGAPDAGDNRYGHGQTVAECIDEIDERWPVLGKLE
jgi:hypothetical protein